MKTNIKQYAISTLASVMLFSLVCTAAHAKDLVKYTVADPTVGAITNTDLVAKALAELHVHIDKQVVKDPSGSGHYLSDGVQIAASRQDRNNDVSPPLSFSEMVHDEILLWQIKFSLLFPRYA